MTNKDFKKVIIWGLPLHSHTHSYIHDCFFKAFTSMGYDTVWVDKTQEKIDNSFLDNSWLLLFNLCDKFINDSLSKLSK